MYLHSGKHIIKHIENHGELITLDDDSRWKVSPYHRSHAKAWQVGDEVMVAASVGSKSMITQSARNETIEAAYLG